MADYLDATTRTWNTAELWTTCWLLLRLRSSAVFIADAMYSLSIKYDWQITMSNWYVRIWKETIFAYFNALFRYLFSFNEEKTQNIWFQTVDTPIEILYGFLILEGDSCIVRSAPLKGTSCFKTAYISCSCVYLSNIQSTLLSVFMLSSFVLEALMLTYLKICFIYEVENKYVPTH